MKKFIFSFLSIIVIALSSWFISHRIHLKQVDLLSANIEALTDNEAVAVKVCYINNPFSSSPFEIFLKCDDRTTDEMIYKCPDTQEMGRKGVSSHCIK